MIENDGIADIKIAVYLFHPKLSYIPKKYDKELKKYYSKNQWVKKLIDLAKENESGMTNDEFLLSLRSLNFSDLITDKIYNEYCNIGKLTDVSIDKLKTQLKTVIVNEQIKVAEDEQVDPVAYVEAIQSINLDAMSDMTSSHSDTISESSFLNISCTDINESFKEVVKSSWDPLNRANAFGGLINNQLILVCAPPGCGKSLFCMQEVIEHLKAGRRCVYAAIGDLTEADFLIRLIAQILNIPLNNVSLDLEANRAKAIQLVPELKNLKLLFISPCEITAGDLYDYLKAKGYLDIDPSCPNGTTYFIDYDSNFAGAEDNLYKKGDEIYAKLVKLSRLPKSIVYVASQPKISAYEQLMIGEKDIGESSRKVHAVDVIVTIGKEPWSTNPIGWICIAKNRRGYPLNAMYFRDIDGRFKEINKNDYQVLKDSPERMTIDCTDAFEAISFNPSIKDSNLIP